MTDNDDNIMAANKALNLLLVVATVCLVCFLIIGSIDASLEVIAGSLSGLFIVGLIAFFKSLMLKMYTIIKEL